MALHSKRPESAEWLREKGPRELELLIRAIVCDVSVPILIADDDRNYRDVSIGAAKLLGRTRDEIIGLKIENSADSNLQPAISNLRRSFLAQGE